MIPEDPNHYAILAQEALKAAAPVDPALAEEYRRHAELEAFVYSNLAIAAATSRATSLLT